jgi:hypothetical protein
VHCYRHGRTVKIGLEKMTVIPTRHASEQDIFDALQIVREHCEWLVRGWSDSVRIEDLTWTRSEWNRMLADAKQAGEEHARLWQQVLAVRYDRKSELIVLDLSNGAQLGVPASKLQGVAEGSELECSDVVILGPNMAIEFPKLDQQFSVEGLLCGRFGSTAWMKKLDSPKSQPRRTVKRPVSASNGSSRKRSGKTSAARS